LHAEVAGAIPFPDFVDGNNARMFQARCSFGFAAKAQKMRFARPLTKANYLQRNYSIETPLSGTKYNALAAATNFFQQLVIPEFRHHSTRYTYSWVRLAIRLIR
jgi:hypothetical protein